MVSPTLTNRAARPSATIVPEPLPLPASVTWRPMVLPASDTCPTAVNDRAAFVVCSPVWTMLLGGSDETPFPLAADATPAGTTPAIPARATIPTAETNSGARRRAERVLVTVISDSPRGTGRCIGTRPVRTPPTGHGSVGTRFYRFFSGLSQDAPSFGAGARRRHRSPASEERLQEGAQLVAPPHDRRRFDDHLPLPAG